MKGPPPSSPHSPCTTLVHSAEDASDPAATHVAPPTPGWWRTTPLIGGFSTGRSGEKHPSRAAGSVAEVYVDRKSTRLNSSHANISYAVFCLKKKKHNHPLTI